MTPARVLQEAGHDITIYAHHFPPATTSNVAAAIWWPDCAIDEALLTPVYRQRALRWQGRSIYWMSRSDALILGGSKEVVKSGSCPASMRSKRSGKHIKVGWRRAAQVCRCRRCAKRICSPSVLDWSSTAHRCTPGTDPTQRATANPQLRSWRRGR